MTNAQEHAVIIGGSSGIGFATARRLLDQGYGVTITGRDANRLEAAKQELSGRVDTAIFDAADRGKSAGFFENLGSFDHLVLAMSGGRGLGPFETLDLDEVRAGYEEKVWPHLSCAQAALPTINRTGSITFVSAVSAQMCVPGLAGVAAINGTLLTVTPILAVELKPLRVNAVAPGVIDTPWWNFLPADKRQSVFDDYAAKTPVGRIGQADDVAKAIAFLVSDSFITGQILSCDGGLRLAA